MKKALVLTAAVFLAGSGIALAQDRVLVEVPQAARDYVIANPSEPVVIEGEISDGYVLPDAIAVHPIPDNPDFGYIYVNGEPVIVSMQNRRVVYYAEGPNAGPPVPTEIVTYIETNPVDPVVIEGGIAEGTIIPQDVPLVAVPDQPAYSYVYVEDRPALIDTQTRRVVWVK
ncbi:hypothetical protein FHW72_001916 [Ochrobactrum sp. RC6B]|uniref:DUF1236 domain-containing protein n=1 Tax=Brucella intermedia TaxID=94625 RepID=A0A6N6R7D4_9HYPH|nr:MULTISPECIES: DUF1236 domain-containing protein [Brucella/Ochrobactrum group]PJR91065.1 DUF1236 domain-containing protein [Ochrobactrum sp. 721/2009]PJT15460.1 DUF1236 domain-containing protein [Ochrobactrum sp. 720/2009]PJT19581.1 DUF1236 domain-containing protein [Ochrobactrum sp. 715/2009]PJT30231.1 DUF1236 domain-containing protein [Ochrobactrum sp. 695/2009]PJT32312.1 DUF1236 domain-containing protein [Ochrobactrum sp. 689/2009]HCH72269.1 DUF1236 domain-containing protein [Ochrobactru